MSRTVIHLPAVALRGMTILPGMVAHFDISRDRSIHAIEEAMVGDQKIFLITQQDASVEEPARDDLYQIGVIAEVKQVIKMPNEIVRVLVEGLERGELASFLSQEKYLMAEVILFDEKTAEEEELMPEAKEAMLRCIRETVLKYQKANGHMSKEFLRQVEEQQDVGTLMQQVAYNLPLYYTQKQKILEAVDLTSQYETLMAILLNEVEVISLKNEFLPFLYPNQYVNFTPDSEACKLALSLLAEDATEQESIDTVFQYVTQHVTYDEDKAATVKTGYLPDIDETLSTGKGICFDYAALMTAMLRSRDIPCKLQIGYAGDIKHAWIDVYIRGKGWVEQAITYDGEKWNRMDPTFTANSEDEELINSYIGDSANYTLQFTR